ncbi:MAG: R3H domain-containing nucleic acid-binding protein [Candidatus Doudnabacteria bacterium]
MQPSNETLKNIILELLKRMDYDAQVFERQEEGRTVFNIKTRDAQLLIGKQGANMEALQYIVRIIFRKQTDDDLFTFALDVDDYKDKRVIYLKELARKAAHHVRQTRKPVSLEPMPSYERRVIHNYLSLFSDISSESVGKEPNRKLVIKNKQRPKTADDGFNFIENS